MNKNIIVFLDPDGDIVDQTSSNNTSDFIIAVAEEMSRTRGEKITPHYATINIGDRYSDRIHRDVVKDPLDICHQHGLCSDSSVEDSSLISRCIICPRNPK